MQSRFIKTAIALAIFSTFSYSANAASLSFSDGSYHEVTEDIDILVPEATPKDRFGINAEGQGTKVDLKGSNITVSVDHVGSSSDKGSYTTYAGIVAASRDKNNGANLIVGSSDTKNIAVNVNVKGTGVDTENEKTYGLDAVGLWAYNSYKPIDQQTNDGGHLTINGKNLTVTVHSEDGVAYGVLAQNASTESSADVATLIINSENTRITATSGVGESSAILAMSEGKLKINGNLYASAENAIVARGGAEISINESNDKTVQLVGDINFNYDKKTSGTSVDADVMVNLSGPDSYWIGNAITSYGSGSTTEENMKVSGLKLGLSDGAQWTPDLFKDSTSANEGKSEIAINQLAFNGGVINVENGDEQVVVIENLTGTGGTINLTAKTDGKTIESGAVSVQTTAKNTRLAVRARGITADDVDDAQSVMESLNAKVDAQAAKTNIVQEGDIKGEMRMDVTADNKASDVQIQENTKLLSMKGVNAAALVAWRDEVAYTNKRMEFLRDNSHAYGAWAQVYGGESAYDDASVDLTTTTVQVGADATIGDWVAGAAFSYMSGDADMSNGQADTDAYTLSLYASRMFDSGLFVNGLARYGRLSTDATAGNMDGSYDNNAFSLGGNVGYRFTFAEQAFVESMFGLQYAYVTGDDYKASNGVKVEQDDFDALIASLGVRTGFDFAKDAGKLYARASVNHDFLGEVDGKASKADLAESMYVDLGGTWFTYGVGTQFNITDNLSVWGNVDRTTGGEVSTRYMMNAGLRYVF